MDAALLLHTLETAVAPPIVWFTFLTLFRRSKVTCHCWWGSVLAHADLWSLGWGWAQTELLTWPAKDAPAAHFLQ
jgi:hypothetical protein